MPDITMKRGRTDRWTKMRLSRARSSGTAASCHMLYSVDCITTTSESEFSVHTPMSRAALATKSGLASTNRAPHGFCCSSKPSTSRPTSSAAGVEVLVADVLLVEALVMRRLALALVLERLALVLVMRRSPEKPKVPERGPLRQS